MKWMAIGEVGAFILGLIAAIGVVKSAQDLHPVVGFCVFMAAWYLTAKVGLWFVHLGYVSKNSNQIS